MNTSIASLKAQLEQLKALQQSGVLPRSQYDKSKAELERRILDTVLQGETPAAAQVRPKAGLVAGLATFVLVLACAGYYWKGTPVAPQAPEQAQAQQQSAQLEQIAAMVDKLAQRMKEQPEDAQGWTMLARSYSVLGRNPEALVAYEKAVALRKDDPSLLADYADVLALKNNRSLEGEPMKWVERALKLDANNPKALALAGTYAYERKDYANAVKLWEKLVATGPADSDFVQQFGPAIAQARSLAGMPPALAPAPASSAAASQPGAAGGTVSGKVTLSPSLAGKTGPEDTVFVYARAASGSRMPLAIVRKQVKDLPFTFSLDDSMAMSPANKLSRAYKVIVGARVSKSGNAMPQPGDLQGLSAPVAVGASDLRVEIKDVVAP